MSKLEHIGLAVEDAQAVRELYRTLLNLHSYHTETVEREGIRTHFISADSAKLELLESLQDDSAVRRFLDKRGEGIHHLAFEVPDVEAAFKRIADAGFTILSDAPYPGADGKDVFFIHPKETHGVLIECCEQKRHPLEMNFIESDVGPLATYPMGHPDRPPVIVLHGAAGSTTLGTAGILRRLAKQFRVIGLDFSGHGQSAQVDVAFSNDLFVSNIERVLDAYEFDRAAIFGFSMGGSVALEAASRLPDRISRLAVHGACVHWDDALADAMAKRLHLDAYKQPFREQYEQSQQDAERVLEKTRAFAERLPEWSASWQNSLGSIQQPTLVSAVDRDELFPLKITTDLHDALPNARLSIIPGEDHALRKLDLQPLETILKWHFK